ncbi:MAG: hypothetical protein JHD02_04740 [Thermoleophilaceae bacterium]|nr:hypothetical protein [Thermoleophilaceae bacterium]
MKKAAHTALLTLAILMALTATAYAGDAGQGWYGEINDKIVTFFGLGLVILFPLIAGIGSYIQGRLERRADERKSAIFKHK